MTLNELFTSIANAIRKKKNNNDKYTPINFASEIESIEPLYDTITIKENGEYNVTEYKNAIVNLSTDETQIIINLVERDLLELTIPYGATKIGKYSFYQSSLDEVTIPNTVTNIGEYAFGRVGLEKIIVGTGVRSIENYAFDYPNQRSYQMYIYFETLKQMFEIEYRSLSSLFWYMSTNNYIYVNNQLIKDIVVPDEITTLKNYSLAWACIESVKFHENITIIPMGFCANARKLKKVEMSDNVTKIENAGFNQCMLLEEIKLSKNLTYIGSQCFDNNQSLTYLFIPKSVTEISTSALKLGTSTNKATIEMESGTPCTISSNTFNISNLNKIYVPKGSSSGYKTATNWSTFADYIFEKNSITLSIDSNYINNENYQYSTDKGVTWNVFTSDSISLNDVASLSFKNNGTGVLQIGTTAGGTDIGTIASGNELTWYSTGDTTIYLTIQ